MAECSQDEKWRDFQVEGLTGRGGEEEGIVYLRIDR